MRGTLDGVKKEIPIPIEKGISAGRFNQDTLDYSIIDSRLKKRFDIGKEVIKTIFHPYVYLDHALLEEKDIDAAEVSRLIARELLSIDGVGYAIPTADIAQGRVPDGPVVRQVLNNSNPSRSGDIYIIYEPQWCSTGVGDPAVVNHGSPWRYDTYVPVIFAGMDLQPQRVYRTIETVDIASTLSAYLSTNRPSGARGEVLREVFR